jgi:hypothetical protein
MAMTPQQLDTVMTSYIDGMIRRMTERDFPGEQVAATAAALNLMKTMTLKPFQGECLLTVANLEAVMSTVITESRKNFQTTDMSANKINALINALELLKTRALQVMHE